MRRTLICLACLALTACVPTSGDDGIRRVGDVTIVDDTAGSRLIIDGNGCQSVVAPGETLATPVTDIDGNPVCTGAPAFSQQ